MKGGYKIIDFKSVPLSDSEHPALITGLRAVLDNNYNKAVLLTNVVLGKTAMDDCFSTVILKDNGRIKLNSYDGYITVDSDSYAHYTEGNSGDPTAEIEEIKEDIGDLSDLDTTDKTSAVNAINEVNTKVSKTEVLASNAQQMIAPIQTTLTASRAYGMYGQFVYNGLLYEATTTIAQGATIVINGNCKLADCVTKQINDLSPFLVNGTYTWVSNGISSPGGGCTFPFYIPKRPGQTLTVNSFRYFDGSWHTLTLDPVTQMAKNMFVARAQRISTAFEMALFEVNFTLS